MRFSVRWLRCLTARRGVKRAQAPEPSTSPDEQAPPERRDEIAGLRREVETLRAEVEKWRRAAEEEAAARAAALQELAASLESAFASHLAGAETEIKRLREALDHKLGAIEERAIRIERGMAEINGRMQEAERASERMRAALEKTIHAHEHALEALREENEARLRDLKESHQAHVRSIERSRDELLHAAKRSRERILKRIEETADFLERGAWPAVPAEEPEAARESAPEPEPSSRLGRLLTLPLRTLRRRKRMRAERKRRTARLERRIALLEDLLRDRWDENVRRGRALRALLLEEEEAFAAEPVLTDETGKVECWLEPVSAAGRGNGNGNGNRHASFARR